MNIFTKKTQLFVVALFAANFAFAGTPYKQHVIGTGTTRIEAEDFDTDGDNVSFHWNQDLSSKNVSDYRKAADPTAGVFNSGGSNGHHIGEMDGGVFTVYTVKVEKAGTYKVQFAFGKDNDQPRDFSFYANNEFVGGSSFTDQTGWEAFDKTITANITLPAGDAVELKFQTGGGYNVDYFDISPEAGEVNYGQGMEVPGRIDLMKWDTGGLYTSYYWFQQIEGNRPSPKGDGDELGHSHQGDWLNYTVTVAEAGYYDLTPGISNGSDHNSVFALRNAKTGESVLTCAASEQYGEPVVVVAPNGAWGNYDDGATLAQTVLLPAGEVTLQFVFKEEFNAKFLDLAKSAGDGIKTATSVSDNSFYNLQGVRVAQPVKGIFIHNGHKVVVK